MVITATFKSLVVYLAVVESPQALCCFTSGQYLAVCRILRGNIGLFSLLCYRHLISSY